MLLRQCLVRERKGVPSFLSSLITFITVSTNVYKVLGTSINEDEERGRERYRDADLQHDARLAVNLILQTYCPYERCVLEESTS